MRSAPVHRWDIFPALPDPHPGTPFAPFTVDRLERQVFIALIDRLDHGTPAAIDAHRVSLRLDSHGALRPADDTRAFQAFHGLASCKQLGLKHLLAAHRILGPDLPRAGLIRAIGPCTIRCPETGVVTYVAPDALSLPRLLDTLLAYASASADDWQVPFVALLLLLLIHPFAEGNGRTARMLFAALCWRSGNPHPVFLLALARLYRHEATALRAGSAAVAAYGDWSVYLDLCTKAVRLATDLWMTHTPHTDFDISGELYLAALEQLWSAAALSCDLNLRHDA